MLKEEHCHERSSSLESGARDAARESFQLSQMPTRPLLPTMQYTRYLLGRTRSSSSQQFTFFGD